MGTGKSKFSGLVQAKAQSQVSEEPFVQAPIVVEAAEPEVAPEPVVKLAPVEKKAPQISPAINMAPQRAKKKGNPDYSQVTVYLKKNTHDNTKIALLKARDERDFSELVEDLLADWLINRTQQA